jgi:hypothetical protein
MGLRLGITPIRADRVTRPGDITDQVFKAVGDADVVIADEWGRAHLDIHPIRCEGKPRPQFLGKHHKRCDE